MAKERKSRSKGLEMSVNLLERSEDLEEKIRQVASGDYYTGEVNVYASDIVELLDWKDRRIKELESALQDIINNHKTYSKTRERVNSQSYKLAMIAHRALHRRDAKK